MYPASGVHTAPSSCSVGSAQNSSSSGRFGGPNTDPFRAGKRSRNVSRSQSSNGMSSSVSSGTTFSWCECPPDFLSSAVPH